MLFELIAFGGIVFWIFAAVIVLALASLVHDEKPGRAALLLIVSFALIVAFTNIPIMDIVKNHPSYIGYGLGAYIAGAAIWALIKWRLFYLPKVFEKYEALRANFIKRRGLEEIGTDPQVIADLKKFMADNYFNIDKVRAVSQNKARITTWMFYWPFSLIATFFGDFLDRVFTTIYNGIHGLMQRMSDRMASKYSELN